MQSYSRGRILFDISSSMRWVGPPTGIVRVERKLALWAYENVHNVVFVFFDPSSLAYCAITRDARQFLTGEAALDTLGLTNPALPGRRRTDRVPASLKPAFLWISQPCRMALNRLERLRLGTQSPWIAHLADRMQRWLMSGKYRSFMVREDETRRPYYPHEIAVGACIDFGSSDTLVCVGSGWGHTNIGVLSDLKLRIGFRMVLLCHDLIPLMFPHFYRAYEVDLFRNYMNMALAIADRIVVNSRTVESDCRAYCMRHNIIADDIIVGFLGVDVGVDRPKSVTKLPAGLRAGQFALLVSTIEPRKGHSLLYGVWRRLMAEGVPQAIGFKLVFAGRAGWMVDDLLTDMRNNGQLAEQILVIHDADDDVLNSLYQGAAFCVYPSAYEGYGLPIIEAFSHGKVVLASSGGALPEVVQGFSPCVDPNDEQAWYEMMKRWIEMPEARRPYEQKIRARFRHPTWSEVGANFFAAISASPVWLPANNSAACGNGCPDDRN
jgi:glycosyltransferase involved in cell wall biosynthesis